MTATTPTLANTALSTWESGTHRLDLIDFLGETTFRGILTSRAQLRTWPFLHKGPWMALLQVWPWHHWAGWMVLLACTLPLLTSAAQAYSKPCIHRSHSQAWERVNCRVCVIFFQEYMHFYKGLSSPLGRKSCSESLTGLIRQASQGAWVLETEHSFSPIWTFIGYHLPQDPPHLLRNCVILPTTDCLLELTSRCPTLREPKGGSILDQSNTSSPQLTFWIELKIEHAGSTSILMAELGQDEGVMLMPRCLELPSHWFCECVHILPINSFLLKKAKFGISLA